MDHREEQDSTLHIPERREDSPGLVALSAPFPGVCRVFEEGEKLGLWRFVRLGAGRVTIPDARVHILGAWDPQYQQLLGIGKMGLLWTSSGGEMDLEPVETKYLTDLLLDPRVEFVWFGDPGLARVHHQKGFYAPYPLSPDLPVPQVEKRDAIAFFNTGGLKKNVYNQLLAVALFQRGNPGWVLETNMGAYQGQMEFLGLNYQLHPWLPREQYHRVLASCRVNLAVSWAETFSYQVAEAGLLGVPSVISRAVPLPGFRVGDPNSPLEVADRLFYAIRHQASMDIRRRTEGVALRNNQLLKDALRNRNLL